MGRMNDDDRNEYDPRVVTGPVVGYLAAAVALVILLMA
jgi:hypothetical protein